MTAAKDIILFGVQAFIVLYFIRLMWIWRRTEKGRGVLSQVAPMIAYWLLMGLLIALIAFYAWMHVGPFIGVKR